jgi:hypothetical protein
MKMTRTADYTGVSFEWETYEEWLAEYNSYVKTKIGEHRYRAYLDNKGSDGNSRWYGHEGGAESVLKAIDSGWPELRERLVAAMDGVELDMPVFPTLTMTRRRKRKWLDDGDDYDQHRTWNGDLEHAWSKPVRTERMQPNTKRVTLAFDVGDNCGVTSYQAMWRAALSLLLCDSLARAGRTFEVWCIHSSRESFRSGPSRYWSGWRVKASHEPVVLDRLAGMLSIGFLRTVGFMSKCMGPFEPTNTLGYAAHEGLPHSLQERRDSGEVVIRITGCYSRQEAIVQYTKAWQEVEACTGIQSKSDVA